MKVNKGDFIEIDFVAKIKDENKIFDLTDEELAKKEKIYNENFSYKPVIICLGENHILKGLDKELMEKEVGKEYIIEIKPEDGFGKKHAELIQLVSTNVFFKQNIKPFPGLQVQIDNLFGIVRSVSGGRTLVDFNHPLAGKILEYKVKILRIITDSKEKIKSLLNLMLKKEISFDFKEQNLAIKEKIPKELHELIEKEIKRLIDDVKKVTFET